MDRNQKPEQSLFIKLWRLTGWVWVGLVVFFTVGSNLPIDIIVVNEASKFEFYSEEEFRPLVKGTSLGHIGAYALLMWWFAQLKHRNQYLRVAVMFLIMGMGLELLQGLIPYRSLSVSDMIANSGGTMFGWMFALVHPQICFPDESLPV